MNGRNRGVWLLYPGLSEHEAMEERRAHGIPLHRRVGQWFDDATDKLGLPRLRTLDRVDRPRPGSGSYQYFGTACSSFVITSRTAVRPRLLASRARWMAGAS